MKKENKRFLQRSFSFFYGINLVSEEVLAWKRILNNLKRREKLEVEDF